MNILLVEDRAVEVTALSAILHPLGHTVVVCADGDMALLQFAQYQLDVVITAAFVPGLDGFALTQAIQQQVAPRWQPVIIVASECDVSLQTHAIEAGRLWLWVQCRDSGPGFDVASALARLTQQSQDHVDERLHGRGLALIQRMAERLSFNENGNEATVLLPIRNT